MNTSSPIALAKDPPIASFWGLRRNAQYLVVLAITTLILIASFLHWPALDLAPSAAVFDVDSGKFLYAKQPLLQLFKLLVDLAIKAWAVILFSIVLLIHLPWRLSVPPFSRRKWLFLALALALGPALTINAVFKGSFGRPRPPEIVEFQGKYPYQSPFEMSALPYRSFTSGHASAGFYICAFAFVVRPKRQRLVYAGGIAAGSAIGLCRIMQGAHFLSDVVFCGLLLLLIFHTLDVLLTLAYRRWPGWLAADDRHR